ncbi:MAG: 1-(5-phosphoribosyl)-5-[(5-phosphoribosylamino)methylideneamino]imidazole-4-carboxamide isomerase [Candidatus Omnitrophota bacterium]
MIIIPAIDIMGGKVVRLMQGKFKEATVYSDQPTEIAKQWWNQGAQLLHVVDLDGAATGQLKNFELINNIVQNIKIQIEVGGGIRDMETIGRLIGIGVSKVVLGTKAIEDKEFLKETLNSWPDKIVVSIDATHGKVVKEGWTSVSGINATDFAKELQELGVKRIIYTDIARDGTLTGPNVKGIKSILEVVKIPVIASGGISDLGDLNKLKDLENVGLVGVIIGKALYERSIYLREAIKFCLPKG